jgi:hypothetical protein
MNVIDFKKSGDLSEKPTSTFSHPALNPKLDIRAFFTTLCKRCVAFGARG